MERHFIIDKYNTWYDWKLILSEKEIGEAEPKTNLVDIDGMNGSLDLSESLTGEITYSDRKIKVEFWTDNGNRQDREKLLRSITAALHGKKVKIIEPDDTEHYFDGRVTVSNKVNNSAYAKLTINATCEPWRYSLSEITREITVNSEAVSNFVFRNNGEKTLSPVMSVKGNINIVYNGITTELSDGDYKISDVKLYSGVNIIGVSGVGSVVFKYREGCL